MTRDVRIAVYGDLNLNVLDGSAVWLQSLATALSLQGRNAVTVVCKASEPARPTVEAFLRDTVGFRTMAAGRTSPR